MIINRIYENQNLLSLLLVCFLVGLRTYQHPCTYDARRLIMSGGVPPLPCMPSCRGQ